jgi:hypothetical protein
MEETDAALDREHMAMVEEECGEFREVSGVFWRGESGLGFLRRGGKERWGSISIGEAFEFDVMFVALGFLWDRWQTGGCVGWISGYWNAWVFCMRCYYYVWYEKLLLYLN